jgi:hypothetical protein
MPDIVPGVTYAALNPGRAAPLSWPSPPATHPVLGGVDRGYGPVTGQARR